MENLKQLNSNGIKKIFLSLMLMGLLSLVFTPSIALAQLEDSIRDNLRPIEKVYDPVDSIRPGTLQEIIAKIIRQVLGLLGVILIALMLYGGYIWMTAAGAEDKISKAKKILTGAIIGLAIILAAYAISAFVFANLLSATGART